MNELLLFIDAKPINGNYIYKHTHVTKATRILYASLRSHYVEFNAVERTIARLKEEIKLVKKDGNQSFKLED